MPYGSTPIAEGETKHGDQPALARSAARGASRWIESGWPIRHVQQTLGHADLKQTSTYLNATLAGIEASMRQMDQRRGLWQSVAIEPA